MSSPRGEISGLESVVGRKLRDEELKKIRKSPKSARAIVIGAALGDESKESGGDERERKMRTTGGRRGSQGDEDSGPNR